MAKKLFNIDGEIFEGMEVLGAGGFGIVIRAKWLSKNEKEVAIKFERKRNRQSVCGIETEKEVYEVLKHTDILCVPSAYMFAEDTNFRYMVLSLLGPTLKKIWLDDSKMNVVDIALKLIDAIEIFHSTGYVHCDIKPENIAMAMTSDQLILFDFGVSKYLGKEQSKNVVPAGSALFMSTNMLKGQLTYANDLKSIAYSLVLLQGKQLPWSDLVSNRNKMNERDFLEKLLNLKEKTNDEIHKGIEPPLRKFIKQIMQLKNDVNYTSLRKMLDSAQ
ncbi:casein kinase 1-like protein 6 [Contarinia nasturtii]|uniref:casein kinase 1-like protein 6 n=1 Tax=Contarinia nasturtii TaxID=265458 RepID=UPI0012D3FD94|nr:casein kinase 1-like protein 6 [Contarinia nasturtii]